MYNTEPKTLSFFNCNNISADVYDLGGWAFAFLKINNSKLKHTIHLITVVAGPFIKFIVVIIYIMDKNNKSG